MNPIKIETLTEFQFVSNPTFAPDGRRIAFVVQHADLKDNDYKGDLYLYDRGSGEVIRLTTSGDVKDYTWTAESRLLFASGRAGNKNEITENGQGISGKGQETSGEEKGTSRKEKETTVYYEIDPNGGEAVEKFRLPLKATAICTVDQSRYLVTAVTELEKCREKDVAYEIADEVPFWFNGKGFTNGLRTRLFLYDSSLASLTPVSGETAELGSFSVRGHKVLYKAYPWADVRGQYEGIYLYDMDSGETRCLLQKDVRRTGMLGFWADDEAVVASSEDNPHGNSKYMDFCRMNLETGALSLLTPYDYSSGSGSVGSDARLGAGRTMKAGDGVCYFVTTRGSSAQLYSISKDGTLQGLVTEAGSCDSFDVQDGHIVVSGLYGNRLAELYLDGKQITNFNDMCRWQTSVPRSYTFRARDGFELMGWVLPPANYEKGKKYPAILNIHGGPRTVFGSVFHHEMQVWASAGYFVFFTNPRGSDGFGTEFGDINGKYGTVDYENLMDFTDYVLEHEPDIDRDRVGVTGGSYGGFMTNWIIGHTDRFRVAASQRSIANWISFEYMSDIGHTFTKDNQAVFACEDPEKLWQHSPLKYAANVRTPTLFVHSDRDYRCHFAEGMEMFAALKILGVETKMLLIRGENHELSRSGKPRNRILRMREILNWMDNHLKIGTGKEEKG